jgi:hypothetical protein
MPNASNGFVTAITGVISGFMVEVILKAFVDSGRIPSYMVFVYQMLGILALVAFVHVTKYWGTLYLFGWWFGSGIMAYSGLLSLWEFLFYSAILILVLFSRIKRGLD